MVAHDLMMVWSRKVDQAGLVQQMHVVALPSLLDHCIAYWQVEVDVVPDPNQESTLVINVSYRVRRTNNLTNLVYPFFLRREQDL